jgi:NADP-dependent 3-hydroxy acid dehydrogenase YdfG
MARVVVTGATAGFGEAIARAFVARGDDVWGTGRREDRLEALAGELGDRFRPLSFDLLDPEASRRAVADLDIDVLVSNAGLALGTAKAWETDLADWETMIATNCTALARLIRLVLPGMVARNSGHLVQIGSVSSDVPYVGGNVYGSTKAFVALLSRNLRADLVGTGVRVTNIEPGAAETEFSVVRLKGDADRAKAVYKGFRPLDAADIADAVVWAVGRPPHVDVSLIQLYPTAQAQGGLLLDRQPQ